MKIALCIMDGLEQFVLTPESDVEKRLIGVLTDRRQTDMSIHRGSFYECNGGWYRQGLGDDSAIICLRPKQANEHIGLEVIEGGHG